MEMYYDGALVMPQNFSVVTADEMVYIDGGDYENFKKNVVALYNGYRDVRMALIGSGITMGYILECAKAGYFAAVSFMAGLGIPVALVSRVAAVAGVVGLGGLATAMWFFRVFYQSIYFLPKLIIPHGIQAMFTQCFSVCYAVIIVYIA